MTKRALVTGSARRVGREIALELASQGYDVAIHYSRSADEALETVRDVEALGVRSAAVKADMLDDGEIAALVPAAVEALGGPLSALVNNASTFEQDVIGSMTLTSWDRSFGSNLKAPVFLTQAFAAQAPEGPLDENGERLPGGVVINMIDQRVRKLTPDFVTYTLAKSALWTFTRTAAMSLAPRVRVNGIGPGPTMIATHQTQEHFDRQRHATPLARGSSGAGIRHAVSFLISAHEVTGQLICVDGGQHLAWLTPDVAGLE